jgi:thiamine-phosphate pyrophosphorylase
LAEERRNGAFVKGVWVEKGLIGNYLRLYLCTGPVPGGDLVGAVEEAVTGGVTLVQLRGKEYPSRELFTLALELRKLTRKHGVPLIINDRLDIALAAEADGVHLGQSDLPVAEARRVAGGNFVIGASAHNPGEARRAEAAGADYLGAGAVFPTGSKGDIAALIGPGGLAAICGAVRIPVVGIGGIGPANVREVKAAGAAGIAVISAILSRPDAGAAAAELACLW